MGDRAATTEQEAAEQRPGPAAMRPTDPPVDPVRADAVVLGSGVAGLTIALGLAAQGRRVILATKTAFGGGSSVWAQGGIAAAVGPEDSPAQHAGDTLNAGAGLGDPGIVDILTREGPAAIRRLIALGAGFDRDAEGQLALGREAAHGRRRILHARGDATGAEVVRALKAAVLAHPAVTVLEHCFAWDLLLEEGQVRGVLALSNAPSEATAGSAPSAVPAGSLHTSIDPIGPTSPTRPTPPTTTTHSPPPARRLHLLAPQVAIATGGCGQLYAYSTNPPEVTGDGIAMAARAGLLLADMEFVQFHPTALAAGAEAERRPLITEALRGEGAWLVDEAGRRFMADVHPDAELAPRDVVARGIWRQLEGGGRAFLDARHAVGAAFPAQFPTVFAACMAAGIDPRVQPIPVAPAAHYFMGGIAVDRWGRSSQDGVWASGEAACSGAHGANRLASNSLLEALVFGARTAEDMGRQALPAGEGSVGDADPAWQGAQATVGPADPGSTSAGPAAGPVATAPAGPTAAVLRRQLQRLMWERAGLIRSEAGLRSLLGELPGIEAAAAGLAPSPAAGELRNLLVLARLVAVAALARRESRGAHWRADFPDTDPRQARRLRLRLAQREVQLDASPEAADAGAEALVAEVEALAGPHWRPEGWWR